MNTTLTRVAVAPVITSDSPFPIRSCWHRGCLLVGFDPQQVTRELALYVAGLIAGGPVLDIDSPETGDRA